MGFSAPRCQEEIMNAPKRPDESVQDVGGRMDDVLLNPDVAIEIREGHPAFADIYQETLKGILRRVQVFRFAGFRVRPHQERESLPLGQTGIPRGAQTGAVFPIKMMMPDLNAVSVRLEVVAQPIAG